MPRHSIDRASEDPDYSDTELLGGHDDHDGEHLDEHEDEDLDTAILLGLGSRKKLGKADKKFASGQEATKKEKKSKPDKKNDKNDHPHKTVHWGGSNDVEDVDDNYRGDEQSIPLKEAVPVNAKPKGNKLKSIIKKGKSKFGGSSGESGQALLGATGRRSSGGRYSKVGFDRFTLDSSDEESDDDSDGDFGQISIDVESHRPRRKRNQNTRTLNLLLFGLLIIAVYFILTLSFGGTKGPNSRPANHKARSKTLLNNGTADFYPTTIVISLDGFHPHYVSKELTPHLDKLMREGSGAPYMTPSFPSSTFPNHWTLITGLYPSSHGIVGNTFYDPTIEKQFWNTDPARSRDTEFWGGEPLWQTLSYQNVSTAVHMWPGSEADWAAGEGPMIVDPFNQTEELYRKLDRIVSWVDRPIDTRPELLLTYVPTVDTLGHEHGIDGPAIEEGIHNVDLLVGAFIEALTERNLTDIVNLVVLSDHGMAPTSDERLIFLDDLINVDEIEHMDGWPLFGLRPKADASEKQIYESLKSQEPEDGSWTVYRKKDMPSRWHFGGRSGGRYQDRIAPIWVVPKTGWSITTHADYTGMGEKYQPHGIHGYDNRDILMRALFLGSGPYFPSFKFEPFENINVYSIICDTLQVYPSKNDAQPLTKALVRLNDDWRDNSHMYPGVDFETNTIPTKATYDELWRRPEHANGTAPTVGQEPTQSDGKNPKQSWSEYLKGQATNAADYVKGSIDWIADKWSSLVGHD